VPRWSEELGEIQVDGKDRRGYPGREHLLADLLGYVTEWPGRVHLVQGSARLTASDVVSAVRRRAAGLADGGLAPGEPVLILAWNSPDWVIAFWAILWAGGVPALGNPWWSEAEVAHALSLVRPRFVLADNALRQRVPPGTAVVSLSAGSGMAPLAAPVPCREDDPAVIVFTSGTTGWPKAVVLSNYSVILSAHGFLQMTRRLPHQLPADHRQEIVLQTAPLFHIGGVHLIAREALLGGTIVFAGGRFDPAEVLRLIQDERIERWFAVPTMAARVIDHPELASTDVTSLRSVTLGGSAVHAELMERVRAAFPSVRKKINTGWGLTEAGGALTAASGADSLSHPGSVGLPLPFVELATDAPDGRSEGELLARTPTQMLSYFGDPDATAGMIDADGWLRTGDLGRIDPEGWVWLTGRKKDLIIRAGENIAPARVEQVLLRHPSVADVAVVGLPDPDLGEAVGAVVVTTPGASLTPRELAHVMDGSLASFERPSQWRILAGPLPVNSSGKLDRAKVVADWLAHDDLARGDEEARV
jgi:acyl-CoA synthetase (AMP-forming)/AMP-acid ligase II